MGKRFLLGILMAVACSHDTSDELVVGTGGGTGHESGQDDGSSSSDGHGGRTLAFSEPDGTSSGVDYPGEYDEANNRWHGPCENRENMPQSCDEWCAVGGMACLATRSFGEMCLGQFHELECDAAAVAAMGDDSVAMCLCEGMPSL